MHTPTTPRVDLQRGTALLGGLSPSQFMSRHWQRKPLLVRSAFGPAVGHGAPLDRRTLFSLAADEEVSSRLIVRPTTADQWTLRHGPFLRRALPALSRPGWTLLVQGVDRRVPTARALLDQFRFIPDARLDDVMVSYASDGGGVGPHLDSYDVFLLQVRGHRRWQVAPATRTAQRALVPDLPLRILAQFEPQHDWLLAPGDMLYLPPGWAHDGTAVGGDCMTCSIGFRAPNGATAARETLARLLDAEADADAAAVLGAPAAYRDPSQPATATPAAIPAGMAAFIREAALRLASEPAALDRAIGTWLSEPHDDVWFEAGGDGGDDTDADARAADETNTGTADGNGNGNGERARSPAPTRNARRSVVGPLAGGVQLDGRTRMLYDDHHLYINGTAVAWPRCDTALLRRLADARILNSTVLQRCSPATRALLTQWVAAGWLHRSTAASPL